MKKVSSIYNYTLYLSILLYSCGSCIGMLVSSHWMSRLDTLWALTHQPDIRTKELKATFTDCCIASHHPHLSSRKKHSTAGVVVIQNWPGPSSFTDERDTTKTRLTEAQQWSITGSRWLGVSRPFSFVSHPSHMCLPQQIRSCFHCTAVYTSCVTSHVLLSEMTLKLLFLC